MVNPVAGGGAGVAVVDPRLEVAAVVVASPDVLAPRAPVTFCRCVAAVGCCALESSSRFRGFPPGCDPSRAGGCRRSVAPVGAVDVVDSVSEVPGSPFARTIVPSAGSTARVTTAAFPNGTSFAASRSTVAGSGRERPAAASRGTGSSTTSAASRRERCGRAAVTLKTRKPTQRRSLDAPRLLRSGDCNRALPAADTPTAAGVARAMG